MKNGRFIGPLLCALVLVVCMAGTAAAGGGYFAFTVSDSNWLPHYGEGATSEAAERAAIRACGNSQSCVDEVESAATPICFAIADAPDWMGWASRVNYEEAIDTALEECRNRSSERCVIISVECRQ